RVRGLRLRAFEQARNAEIDASIAIVAFHRDRNAEINASIAGVKAQRLKAFEQARNAEIDASIALVAFHRARNNLGVALKRRGRIDEAIEHYKMAIEVDPDFAEAHSNLGTVLQGLKRHDEALACFRRALQIKPDFVEVLNNLAWILATCEDAEIRDGAQAVRLAERACELTDYEFPAMLDTLGAAYAEAGQFDQAVQTAQNAFQLALASKNAVRAKNIQNRLELYKANRPYRESFNLETPTRK
ncbi:hypothetical protein LCGC14_3148110, partial [marine sediment metagenome]